MYVEKRYLDKNYRVKNYLITRRDSLVLKAYEVLADVVNIFSISIDEAKKIVIEWLVNHNFDRTTLPIVFPEISVSIDQDTFKCELEASSFSTSGSKRETHRYIGPIIDLTFNKIKTDRLLVQPMSTIVSYLMERKFDMEVVRVSSFGIIKHKFHGCVLNEFIDDANFAFAATSYIVFKVLADYEETEMIAVY